MPTRSEQDFLDRFGARTAEPSAVESLPADVAFEGARQIRREEKLNRTDAQRDARFRELMVTPGATSGAMGSITSPDFSDSAPGPDVTDSGLDIQALISDRRDRFTIPQPGVAESALKRGFHDVVGLTSQGTEVIMRHLRRRTPELLDDVLNLDEAERFFGERAERHMIEALSYPAKLESWDDVDSLSDLGDFVVDNVVTQFPHLASLAVGATAAGLAGRVIFGGLARVGGSKAMRAAIGKRMLRDMYRQGVLVRGQNQALKSFIRAAPGIKKAAGATGAVTVAGLRPGIGEVDRTLAEAGIPKGERDDLALIGGLAVAAIDATGILGEIMTVFRRAGVSRAVGESLMKQAAKNFGLGAASGAAIEAPTEVVQELAMLVAAHHANPDFELYSPQNVERLKQAAIAGGLTGAVLTGIGRGTIQTALDTKEAITGAAADAARTVKKTSEVLLAPLTTVTTEIREQLKPDESKGDNSTEDTAQTRDQFADTLFDFDALRKGAADFVSRVAAPFTAAAQGAASKFSEQFSNAKQRIDDALARADNEPAPAASPTPLQGELLPREDAGTQSGPINEDPAMSRIDSGIQALRDALSRFREQTSEAISGVNATIGALNAALTQRLEQGGFAKNKAEIKPRLQKQFKAFEDKLKDLEARAKEKGADTAALAKELKVILDNVATAAAIKGQTFVTEGQVKRFQNLVRKVGGAVSKAFSTEAKEAAEKAETEIRETEQRRGRVAQARIRRPRAPREATVTQEVSSEPDFTPGPEVDSGPAPVQGTLDFSPGPETTRPTPTPAADPFAAGPEQATPIAEGSELTFTDDQGKVVEERAARPGETEEQAQAEAAQRDLFLRIGKPKKKAERGRVDPLNRKSDVNKQRAAERRQQRTAENRARDERRSTMGRRVYKAVKALGDVKPSTVARKLSQAVKTELKALYPALKTITDRLSALTAEFGPVSAIIKDTFYDSTVAREERVNWYRKIPGQARPKPIPRDEYTGQWVLPEGFNPTAAFWETRAEAAKAAAQLKVPDGVGVEPVMIDGKMYFAVIRKGFEDTTTTSPQPVTPRAEVEADIGTDMAPDPNDVAFGATFEAQFGSIVAENHQVDPAVIDQMIESARIRSTQAGYSRGAKDPEARRARFVWRDANGNLQRSRFSLPEITKIGRLLRAVVIEGTLVEKYSNPHHDFLAGLGAMHENGYHIIIENQAATPSQLRSRFNNEQLLLQFLKDKVIHLPGEAGQMTFGEVSKLSNDLAKAEAWISRAEALRELKQEYNARVEVLIKKGYKKKDAYDTATAEILNPPKKKGDTDEETRLRFSSWFALNDAIDAAQELEAKGRAMYKNAGFSDKNSFDDFRMENETVANQAEGLRVEQIVLEVPVDVDKVKRAAEAAGQPVPDTADINQADKISKIRAVVNTIVELVQLKEALAHPDLDKIRALKTAVLDFADMERRYRELSDESPTERLSALRPRDDAPWRDEIRISKDGKHVEYATRTKVTSPDRTYTTTHPLNGYKSYKEFKAARAKAQKAWLDTERDREANQFLEAAGFAKDPRAKILRFMTGRLSALNASEGVKSDADLLERVDQMIDKRRTRLLAEIADDLSPNLKLLTPAMRQAYERYQAALDALQAKGSRGTRVEGRKAFNTEQRNVLRAARALSDMLRDRQKRILPAGVHLQYSDVTSQAYTEDDQGNISKAGKNVRRGNVVVRLDLGVPTETVVVEDRSLFSESSFYTERRPANTTPNTNTENLYDPINLASSLGNAARVASTIKRLLKKLGIAKKVVLLDEDGVIRLHAMLKSRINRLVKPGASGIPAAKSAQLTRLRNRIEKTSQELDTLEARIDQFPESADDAIKADRDKLRGKLEKLQEQEQKALESSGVPKKHAERVKIYTQMMAHLEKIMRDAPEARIVFNDTYRLQRDTLSQERDKKKRVYRDDDLELDFRVPFIFVSKKVANKDKAYRLAHEIGHLVSRTMLDRAPASIQKIVRDAIGGKGENQFQERFAEAVAAWAHRHLRDTAPETGETVITDRKELENIERKMGALEARQQTAIEEAAGPEYQRKSGTYKTLTSDQEATIHNRLLRKDAQFQRMTKELNELAAERSKLRTKKPAASKDLTPLDSFLSNVGRALAQVYKSFRSMFTGDQRNFDEFMRAVVSVSSGNTKLAPRTRMGRQMQRELAKLEQGAFMPYRKDGPVEADFGPGTVTASRVASRMSRGQAWLNQASSKSIVLEGLSRFAMPIAWELSRMGPTANWLLGHLRPTPSAGRQRESINHEISRRRGPVMFELGKILDSLPGAPASGLQGIRDVLFPGKRDPAALAKRKAIATELLRRTTKLPPNPALAPDVAQAVTQIQDFLTFLHGDLSKFIPQLGWRDDYYPLVIDIEKWIADRDGVVTALMSAPYNERGDVYSRQDAEAIWNDLATTDGVLHDLNENFKDDAQSPGFSYKNKRTWSPKLQQALLDYYQDDIGTTLITYVNAGYKRATWQNRFGLTEAEIDAENLARNQNGPFETTEMEDLGISPYDPLAKLNVRLKKAQLRGELTKAELKRITHVLIPAVTGAVSLKTDPRLRRLNSWAVVYQNYRILGLTLLSNVTDIGVMINRGGFKNFADAVKTLKAEPDKIKQLAREMGIVQDEFTDHVMNDTNTFMTAKAQKWNEVLFKLNGMQMFTNYSRFLTVAMARSFFRQHAQGARDGDPISIQALEDFNLSPAEIDAWMAVDTGLGKPGNPKVIAAIHKFTDESVLRPDAVGRPAWHSDARFSVFSHLKGFYYQYTAQILQRIWNDSKRANTGQWGYLAATMPLMMLAAATIPFAMAGWELRRAITGADDRYKPQGADYAWELIQRSGMTGVAQLLIDEYNNIYQFRKPPLLAVGGPTMEQFVEFFMKDFDYFLSKSVPLVAVTPAARSWVRDVL